MNGTVEAETAIVSYRDDFHDAPREIQPEDFAVP